MTQMMMARAAGDQSARVMGYAAMPILVAPILGPVVAGLILQHASWRWLFLINIPFGISAIVLAALLLPNDRDDRRRTVFDLTGFLLLSPGLVLFLYSLDRLGEATGWIILALGLGLITVFTVVARRKPRAALIDLGLFANRTFTVAVIVQFLSNGAAFAGRMLIPIFLIKACNLSPSETGLMVAPLGVGMLFGYPMIGRLIDWLGIRRVSVGGGFIAAVTTLSLVYLADHGFTLVLFVPTLLLRGAGMSLIGLPSISTAYAMVEREDMPMASTALNIVQRLGGPVLTTICASFLGWRLSLDPPSISHHAFAEAFLLLGAFQLLLCLVALFLPIRLVASAPR